MSDSDEEIQPEIKLIELLRRVLFRELGENVSNKKLGSLLLSPNRFNRTIREKSKFRSNSIDKIEENIKTIVKDKENLRIATNGLKSYRITRGYIIAEDAKDWPEFILIKKFQAIFLRAKQKLIPLSNLGNFFGSKHLFNEVLTSNYKFRAITINRIEQKLNHLLEEPFLSEAIEALNEYRIKRDYLKNSTIQNQEEVKLIKVLQDLYSKELGYLISLNELSKKFGSRLLFNDALRKGTKFVKLTLERMHNSVETDLSKMNQQKALVAIVSYMEYSELFNYDYSMNQPEIELINYLRKIFTPFNGSLISMNELTNILYPDNINLIHFALKNNTVFMNSTIDEMIKNVKKKLTGKEVELAIQTLKQYKKLKRFEKKIEYFNAESKLNEEICRYIFEILFHPLKFPTVSIYTFPWLTGPKGGPMHIDGYNISINLGFEYNGIQHYEIDNLYNKSKIDLLYQQQKDAHKSKLVNENKVRVMDIPYTVKLKDRIQYIIEECKRLNIKIPRENINISVNDIEKNVREKIKNKKDELDNNKLNNKNKKTKNSVQDASIPFPSNKLLRKNFNDEDFTDPYLWFSPQVRETIRSKAESLMDQVHTNISAPEDISDRWDEVSNYDWSEIDSISTDDLVEDSEENLIPDQEIESNPEFSEIQESEDIKETEFTPLEEETEDNITEQQDLTEDQATIPEDAVDAEQREGIIKPDDLDPIIQPISDPSFQPINDPILIPNPNLITQEIVTPQREIEQNTQTNPHNQQKQEDDSQIPEKSQEEIDNEQNIEEITKDSETKENESEINDPISQTQIPELSESESGDSSGKPDTGEEGSENVSQEDSDEKEEDSDNDKENKDESEGDDEGKSDEKDEKDDKDDPDDDPDEEKKDGDSQQSEKNDDDSKEDEEEPDDNNQEEKYDDTDDSEEDSESGFDPEDIYDPINVIDYSDILPEIPAFQSSNLKPYSGDVIIIDSDHFREPIDDIQIIDDDLKEDKPNDIPIYDGDGYPDDLPNDKIKDNNLDKDLEDFI